MRVSKECVGGISVCNAKSMNGCYAHHVSGAVSSAESAAPWSCAPRDPADSGAGTAQFYQQS